MEPSPCGHPPCPSRRPLPPDIVSGRWTHLKVTTRRLRRHRPPLSRQPMPASQIHSVTDENSTVLICGFEGQRRTATLPSGTGVTRPPSHSTRQSEACDPRARPQARGLFGCLEGPPPPPAGPGRACARISGEAPGIETSEPRVDERWSLSACPPQGRDMIRPRAAEGVPSSGPAPRAHPSRPGTPARPAPLSGDGRARHRRGRHEASGAPGAGQGCRAAACQDGPSSCRPVPQGSHLPHVAPEPLRRGRCQRPRRGSFSLRNVDLNCHGQLVAAALDGASRRERRTLSRPVRRRGTWGTWLRRDARREEAGGQDPEGRGEAAALGLRAGRPSPARAPRLALERAPGTTSPVSCRGGNGNPTSAGSFSATNARCFRHRNELGAS